jgi:glutathione S-transferase
MLTIYGRANSSNVSVAMWAIGELGLPHRRLDYGRGYATTQTPDYLAMNPTGLVPTLDDDGVVLFESGAILRYLGSKYGDATFWPADPAIRGPLDSWAEWGKNAFVAGAAEIFYEVVRRKPENKSPEGMRRAVAAVTPLATMLNARLTGRTWIGGEDFTFADVAVGHQLYRYFTISWDRPDLPALAAYYDRLTGRPAFRDHVMVSYDAHWNTM